MTEHASAAGTSAASQFSLRGGLAWMSIAQVVLFGVQFSGSLVVARLLSPYELGVFTLASSIAGLLSVLRVLGLYNYIIRARELSEAIRASIFTINAGISLIVCGLIVALSAAGGLILKEDGVRRALIVLAALPIIDTFNLLPSAGLERDGDFRSLALVSMCRVLVATALMFVLIHAGYGYTSLAWSQVAGALTSVSLVNIRGVRHARVRFSLEHGKEIGRYGLQMLTISGITLLSARMAELILGHLLGLSALALYSRASGLNQLLWENVQSIITRVVTVDLAGSHRRGEPLRARYLNVVRMTTAVLWPAFAGMAVIAGPLIVTLYGHIWATASLPLSLLSLASLTLVNITMAGVVYVVTGQTGRQARLEGVRAGVDLALFAVGCLGGIGWAAAGRVASALFSLALYRRDLNALTRTSLSDLLPIYASSLALTAAAVAPAIGVMSYYGWSAEAPLAVVLGGVAAGVLAWAGAVLLSGHPLADELRLVWQRVLGRLLRRRPLPSA